MELDMKATGKICARRCAEYRRAGKKEKGRILDEVLSDAGGNRDYWATKLRNYNRTVFAAGADGKSVKYVARDRKKGEKHPGGRPKVYTEEFVKLLTGLWMDFGRRCPKRLLPDLRDMIEYLCADEEYRIDEKNRALLMKISPAQASRLLAPARKKLEEIYGESTTKPGKTHLRTRVPVRAYKSRAGAKPGFFASDTVAHSGGSPKGQYRKSLTFRDFYSGWMEARPLLNAAERWVREGAADVKAKLPFPLLGIHDDNGGEYINHNFIEWCIDQFIKQTRGRPNYSNDNCLAEQTNYDAVRKTVGYFRFDTQTEYDAMVVVYEYLCPLYNYWFHSDKLANKEYKPDGKTRKVYDKELKTPFERLLESPDLADEYKDELRRRKAEQNPVQMNRKLNEAVQKLLKINMEKRRMKQTGADAK
jgi:transposase InsO family protein